MVMLKNPLINGVIIVIILLQSCGKARDVGGPVEVVFDNTKVDVSNARYQIIHDEDAEEREYQSGHLTYKDTMQNYFHIKFTIRNKQNIPISKIKVTKTLKTKDKPSLDGSDTHQFDFETNDAIKPGEEQEIVWHCFAFPNKNWFEVEEVVVDIEVE